MLIKDMFRKPIDRNIQGVIVVGEDGLNDEKNELEEYVVTRELQRHFKEFYENYKQGIIGKTRKNGVWISGFFGSGKSHFENAILSSGKQAGLRQENLRLL